MSVMVFLDESRFNAQGKNDFMATCAGVAFETATYDGFCRKLFRLKGKFFKRDGVGDYPLRGRMMLNQRARDSYRKAEFMRELFSLCRLQKVVAFSTTRRFGADASQNATASLSAVALEVEHRAEALSVLLAYAFERINSFMLEQHPGRSALLIFKSETAQGDRALSASVMNFMYKTPFGGGFHGLIGAPAFVPAAYSLGLQVADLFAYIVNQHHAGRPGLQEYFAEVQSMQFVSSFQQDEFELKGMNLIE